MSAPHERIAETTGLYVGRFLHVRVTVSNKEALVRFIQCDGAGLALQEVTARLTPEDARALAHQLHHAADICEAAREDT